MRPPRRRQHDVGSGCDLCGDPLAGGRGILDVEGLEPAIGRGTALLDGRSFAS